MEQMVFWRGTGIRAFTTFGFVFFSTLITFKSIVPVLESAFIGAGLYFFTELMKYYKLQPDKKVIKKTGCKNIYSFLI